MNIDVDLTILNRENRKQRLIEARKKGRHTKEAWDRLKKEFNNICVRCGKKGLPVKDHIIPIRMGGSDSIENIQPICWTCNVSKRAESFDWKEYRRCNASA